MKFIPLFFLVLVSSACSYSQVSEKPLGEIVDSLKIDKNRLSILIDKSDYQLYVMADSIVVKAYPVVFGGNPVDDKLREGDQCTPEGDFHIVSKYPHKSWSKFIWINYPTKDSWKKHNKAKGEGSISKNASIGGEIGIHGVPEGMDSMVDTGTNWTLGCISMKNKDVDELYPFVLKSTVIRIVK